MNNELKILQLSHGRIYPPYSSAYSMRVHQIFKDQNRKIFSVGGFFIRDRKIGYIEQYRSLILTALSVINGNRSFEIMISQKKFLRKKFIKRSRELINESDIIVFEGPWLYPVFKDDIKNKFIVYDAHNIEYLLRKGNKYEENVKKIEEDLAKNANIIFTVTKEDLESFKNIYSIALNKIYLIPHTIPIKDYGWKGKLSNDLVFIGSLYEPNILALKEIENLAEKMKEFNFHIIGNISKYPGKKKMKNIIYHGVVSEEKKDEILNNSLLALNPVTIGSGRNVKMFDYLAHGLPVISTKIGVRGFDENKIKDFVFIEDIENFGKKIIELSENRMVVEKASGMAYGYAKNLYEIENKIDPMDIIYEHFKKHNLNNG
ncbi:MAG: glycosyltransferase [Thermoplasmata archaeon]